MSTLPAGVRPYISFWTMFVDKYGEPSEPVELKAYTGEAAEEMARGSFARNYPGGVSFKVCASKWECERAIEAVTCALASLRLQKRFGADAKAVQATVQRNIDRNEKHHRAAREANERVASNAADSRKDKGPRN